MDAVMFRLLAKVMDEAGWVDHSPQFSRAHEDLNEIVRAAKCTFKKAGKGGHYTFRCNVEQASFIEDHLRDHGERLVLDADKASRQTGRDLLKAAEQIAVAIRKAHDGK